MLLKMDGTKMTVGDNDQVIDKMRWNASFASTYKFIREPGLT